MDFIDSIQLSLSKYFDINDKADRKEFWLFFIFFLVGSVGSFIIDIMAGSLFYVPYMNIGLFSGIFLLLTIIPYLTVGMRRLNDAGLSKLFMLLLLVPLGNIAMLFLWAKKSKV